MTNELDTSWHTSSHSRQQPPSSSPKPGRRGSAGGNSSCGVTGRGSGVSKTMTIEGMHGSMSSVDEDCGVAESTRTLSVETHGPYNDNRSQASGGKHHDDDDDDDDDDLNDVDSFGETSPTDRTDKEKLEKCLASGVSSRLMEFRINYDSKAAFDLDDIVDADDEDMMETNNNDGKKTTSSKPRKNRIVGMANALRRVVHRGSHDKTANAAGLSSPSHQKKQTAA